MPLCKRCGGEVVRKRRSRLFLVGLLMLASTGLVAVSSLFWVPAIILAPTGVYLIAWATVGNARWCRGCKRFDGV